MGLVQSVVYSLIPSVLLKGKRVDSVTFIENLTITEFNPNGPTVVYPTQKADTPSTHKSIFLAGAIDMGAAVDWQAHFIESLKGVPTVTYNPRRPTWDPNWPQTINFKPFKEQVEWELNAMDKVNYIAMYFPHHAAAPISLLELGLYSTSKKLLVGCPKEYYRRGNVEIVCKRLGIPFFETLEELESEVKSLIRQDLQLKDD